jgi:hypothetical protein
MFATTVLTLRGPTREAVLALLKAKGDARSLEAVVDEALHAWLQKATCEDPQAAHAAARGYQWKSLFLPDGTLVRFDYCRETYQAEVRGNNIIYQGRAYSPRQLLLHITGTVRNAWRELWLRSPGDARWHLADTRRRILRRTPSEAPAIRVPRSCTVLHRDDIVRDDQPDLACKLGGGGPAKAGRSGKRDRRAGNGIFALPFNNPTPAAKPFP